MASWVFYDRKNRLNLSDYKVKRVCGILKNGS